MPKAPLVTSSSISTSAPEEASPPDLVEDSQAVVAAGDKVISYMRARDLHWGSDYVQPMPELSEDQLNDLSDSILEHGILVAVDVALIDGRHIVLDGNNRVETAALIDPEAAMVPVRRHPEIQTMEQAIAYARRVNLERRHLDAEARMQLVAEMLGEGKTQQEIAKDLNTSQQTVSRDARKAEAKGITHVSNSPEQPKRGRPRGSTKTTGSPKATSGSQTAQDAPAANHQPETPQPADGQQGSGSEPSNVIPLRPVPDEPELDEMQQAMVDRIKAHEAANATLAAEVGTVTAERDKLQAQVHHLLGELVEKDKEIQTLKADLEQARRDA